ncbi:unnamed protein product [Schistosoma mattheei]|uniref:Antistasin-like domain-containing protein n=1 Tax=Schistosoma mattheei TaxID=31246 RepID=A0AA85BZE9_9TREM|nr:unnamed protein product [Schistosoma mattheei]
MNDIETQIENLLQENLKKLISKIQKTKTDESKQSSSLPSSPSESSSTLPDQLPPSLVKKDENYYKYYRSNHDEMRRRPNNEDDERKLHDRHHHEHDYHHDRRDDEHRFHKPEEYKPWSDKHEPRPSTKDRNMPPSHHHDHPDSHFPSHHPFPLESESESHNPPSRNPFPKPFRHHESYKKYQEIPYRPRSHEEEFSDRHVHEDEDDDRNSHRSKIPPKKPKSIVQGVSATVNPTQPLSGNEANTKILDSVSIPLTINIDDLSSTDCPFTPCTKTCPGGLYKLNETTGCATCNCCPSITCYNQCIQGYEADEYGCPTCKCLTSYY